MSVSSANRYRFADGKAAEVRRQDAHLVYYASVQTMPFVRPHFREMVAALDFVIANDYPARGEYTDPV